MWWAVAAQFASAAGQYAADSVQSKAQKAWQRYSNKMTELSATVGQNAITQNEWMAHDALT